jgi:serine/threonine protein kinase
LGEDFPVYLAGFQAGSLLAGYRLEAQVGAGGMGAVFRARDERLGRLVALKILAPVLAADRKFRRRFIAEWRAVAAVDDPHIIPVYEAGEANGVLFIAMRFVRGGDLRLVLQREGALAPARAAAFISQVASALDAAHKAGLIHGNIKSANILLDIHPDRTDHVYLSDFGVSKWVMTWVNRTGIRQFLGTPEYAAPEQIEGREVDGRADQYALACMAYQLLTGAIPFEREQGMAALLAHLSEPPPSLGSRRPGLPGAADPVLAKALAKVPQKRYGSCREFADALRKALGLAPEMPLGFASAAGHPQTEISPGPKHPMSAPDVTGKAAVPAGQSAAATRDWAPSDLIPSRLRRGTRPSLPTARDSGLLQPPPGAGQPRPRPPGARRGRAILRVAATSVIALVVTAAVSFVVFRLVTSHSPNSSSLAADQGSKNIPATAILSTYPGQQQRGVFQAISRIVAAGNTMVTTGSQTSDGTVRQQFFASSNGGATWHLAPVQMPGGGQPPLGHVATRIANDPGGWMAVGQQAIWTSRNGLTWTLAATHGIGPQLPGDSIDVLTGTADGFLAAGGTGSGGGNQAVIWVSHDGMVWQRLTATYLGLTSSGQTPMNINYATSSGNDTLISNGSGVWLSADGGSRWTPVTVPVDHGAQNQISGLSFDGSGLIAVRPGNTTNGAPDGVAYFSSNGSTWQFASIIDPAGGWTPGVVKGSKNGFVVTGTVASQKKYVAYASKGTGTTWLPTGTLGNTSSGPIPSATIGPGGTVIAVGYTYSTKTSQRAVFIEAHPEGKASAVPVADIPGGLIPEVAVKGTAVGAGTQIAVGSANGYPAVWRRTSNGTWTLVSSLPLVSRAPGLTALSSVTHGSVGWIAAGAPGPVIYTSATGTNWQPAGTNIVQDLTGAATVVTAWSPAGYLIYGAQIASGGTHMADCWWSPDLTSWTRAQIAESATGSNQALATAAGEHGFVMVGSHNSMPAVWTTANGQFWTTDVLPLPTGASAAVLQQVAIAGNIVVALGQQTMASGAIPLEELSTDGGMTWHQVQFISAAPGIIVTALTAHSGEFTAAVQVGAAGQQGAAVWTSGNGTTWTQLPVSGLTGGGNHDITTMSPSGSAVTAIESVQTQETQESITLLLPVR